MNDLNFFASIGAFHVHVLFHSDGIDDEWSKLHMLTHHSCTFTYIQEASITSEMYCYIFLNTHLSHS